MTTGARAESPDLRQVAHESISVGDIEVHVAHQGKGHAVVMCHGFPGLWYSWRHQFSAVAGSGRRAIALDMPGYGRSSQPEDVAAYARQQVISDIVGVIETLNLGRIVLMGHDWGALTAWEFAQRHPDLLDGLIVLSQNFRPRGPEAPTTRFRALAEKQFFHMNYFQADGPADRELNGNVRLTLASIMWALSGESGYQSMLSSYDYLAAKRQVRGGRAQDAPIGYLEVLPDPPLLPWSWLTVAEFETYVAEYERTGFSGGLRWYRAEDITWREAESIAAAKVYVPTCFIAGSIDLALNLNPQWRQLMHEYVPGLKETHLVDGAGHFVQMEAPDAVNEIILGFLNAL
jgi:pimeloyl-ACP methyl ester carboxylesterase